MSVGHLRIYVPPNAANGRYWLPAIDFNMHDADATAVDGSVRAGWIEVSGGVSPTATLGGDGSSTVTMHTTREGQTFSHIPGRFAVLIEGKASDSAIDRAAGELGLRSRLLANRWRILEGKPFPEDLRHATADLSASLRKEMQTPEAPFVKPWLERDGFFHLVDRNITVVFDEALSPNDMQAVLIRLGIPHAKLTRTLINTHKNAYTVSEIGNDGLGVISIANQLARAPEVFLVEPHTTSNAFAGLVPSDPLYSYSTELHDQSDGVGYDIEEAWDEALGAGVKVMVLDNGIEETHPDLNVAYSENFFGDSSFNDNDCHGTTVAGFAGALMNNGEGTVGTAPQILLYSGRIATSESRCSRAWIGSHADLRAGLDAAVGLGIQVTVNSFYFSESLLTAQTYQNAADAGVLHFACAGNDAEEGLWFPASLPSTIAVASINRDKTLASSSNYGFAQELVAFGTNVNGLDRVGNAGYTPANYFTTGGCSFATPAVAGIAALLMQKEPTVSAAEVRRRLRYAASDLGAPGWDPLYGWGLPNAARLLQQDVFFRSGYEN